MDAGFAHRARLRRSAVAVVAVVGLHQGIVPLAVRVALDRDQRLAPALSLPGPWWWIACLMIGLLAVVVVGTIETGAQDGGSGRADGAPVAEVVDGSAAPNPGSLSEIGSAVVFLVGLYNGILPFPVRLLSDGHLLLSPTSRLPAPWWWLVSLAVIATAGVLLAALDRSGKHPHAPRGPGA